MVLLRALSAAAPTHWVRSHIALTFYEQRRYAEALRWDRRAVRLEPRCALPLWGMAGALDMLERDAEAIALYRKLATTGARKLGEDSCGEGVRWARGLKADCWYRLARIFGRRGDRAAALRALAQHRALRSRGARSIYAAADVRAFSRSLGRS